MQREEEREGRGPAYRVGITTYNGGKCRTAKGLYSQRITVDTVDMNVQIQYIVAIIDVFTYKG